MKQKKVWRFYCDHCKKSGGGKRAMETHERHCTLNPERKCRACSLVHGAHPTPMPELIAALYEGGYKKLREVSNECPACILATLRQAPPDAGRPFKDHEAFAGIPAWREALDDGRDTFDFRTEMKSLFNEINGERYP